MDQRKNVDIFLRRDTRGDICSCMSLSHLTAHELLPMLASGEICALDVTRSALDTIEKREPEINAFISVNADEALRQAQTVDDKRIRGEPLGALAGIIHMLGIIPQQRHLRAFAGPAVAWPVMAAGIVSLITS